MRYTSNFNFNNFKTATQIKIFPSEITYPSKNYVLADMAAADSDKPIYITPHGVGNYLIYCTEPIYLNESCVSMAKGLTKLINADFFNTKLFNYKYVRNMHTSFTECQNLTGHPVSPNKIGSLYGTYYNCQNLTGDPKIGLQANNLIATYYNCINLNGEMYNSNNVISMVGTYYNCFNIVSTPPLEVSAITLYDCFYNCTNLTGAPANCNNAFITINAYYNCANIYGEFNWLFNGFHQASKINMTNMFYHRDPSQMLTIYTWENYAIANALLNYSQKYGNIYGTGAITWTQTDTLTYYNSQYNTKIILLDDGDEPDPDPD